LDWVVHVDPAIRFCIGPTGWETREGRFYFEVRSPCVFSKPICRIDVRALSVRDEYTLWIVVYKREVQGFIYGRIHLAASLVF
jgi:hypothetical protein